MGETILVCFSTRRARGLRGGRGGTARCLAVGRDRPPVVPRGGARHWEDRALSRFVCGPVGGELGAFHVKRRAIEGDG